MKRIFVPLLAVAGLGAWYGAVQAMPVEKPVAPVATNSGQVAGLVLPSGVKAWLGVPFAQAPVGQLRWQAPQAIHWNGVWHADRKMPECMQVLRPHNINHYFGEEATSEDCLYMNIWAPGKATASAGLPVIVFIYGGGGTIGSSGMALYDGEQVAASGGAVFVNFNYRVGVLGFLAHPELSKEQGGHSGNYGYLDQNAALRWIHDNIARFGGDPSKVVIMGQSFGAGSVVQQFFSPLSKGLFRGAVMSSGCNWASSPGQSLAEGEANGLEVQKALGADSIADLRNIPADKIIAAQTEFQVGARVTGGIRARGINDGYFMPGSQLELLQSHATADVPIIASFNHDEAVSALQNAKTVAEYESMARQMYGDDADEFLKLYPVASAADIVRVGGQVAREGGLEGNARNCAILQNKYNHAAAYIDTFSRKHPYAPDAAIADQNIHTIGAYHTGDIPYWFGTLEALNSLRHTRNWTDGDRKLSREMMHSLISFAATGNPATADVPWPAWRPDSERKIEFNVPTISVVPLNVAGIEWLRSHVAKPLPPAPGTGGNRIGNGPRD